MKFTVIVPIRGRTGWRVHNCLNSVKNQEYEGEIELIIAEYGTEINEYEGKDYHWMLKDFIRARYRPKKHVYVETDEPWSTSIARNIGLRRAKGEYAMTLDVDCIIEPKVVQTVNNLLDEDKNRLIVSRIHDLPEIKGGLRYGDDYKRLDKIAKLERPGVGALMAATKEWWHKVRGFDERMKGWGGPDSDLVDRAEKDGLEVLDISRLELPETKTYHQWHRNSKEVMKEKLGVRAFINYRRSNRRIWKKDPSIVRNDVNWGKINE